MHLERNEIKANEYVCLCVIARVCLHVRVRVFLCVWHVGSVFGEIEWHVYVLAIGRFILFLGWILNLVFEFICH